MPIAAVPTSSSAFSTVSEEHELRDEPHVRAHRAWWLVDRFADVGVLVARCGANSLTVRMFV